MKVIKSESGVEIKVYSSPKEMPIGRYSDFKKYLIPEDVNFTLNKSKSFIQEGKIEEAEIEIDNAIAAVLSSQKGVALLTYAFAVMVAEIGGKQANDTTIDGLDSVIAELSNLNITQQQIEDAVEILKKKIDEEIERLFPNFLDQTSSLLYFSKMKRYILLACDLYSNQDISDEDKTELRSLKNWFYIKDGAKKYNDASVEVEKNFLSLLSLLELSEDCSVLTFYSKLDYITKKHEGESSNA